jgi:glycosyltransferase involved in cell wall biosynthesis
VIVVDDGSTDDTAKIAEEMGTRVIGLEQTMGPALARNRGAEEAKGEVLVFIDADVFVKPELSRLVPYAATRLRIRRCHWFLRHDTFGRKSNFAI